MFHNIGDRVGAHQKIFFSEVSTDSFTQLMALFEEFCRMTDFWEGSAQWNIRSWGNILHGEIESPITIHLSVLKLFLSSPLRNRIIFVNSMHSMRFITQIKHLWWMFLGKGTLLTFELKWIQCPHLSSWSNWKRWVRISASGCLVSRTNDDRWPLPKLQACCWSPSQCHKSEADRRST